MAWVTFPAGKTYRAFWAWHRALLRASKTFAVVNMVWPTKWRVELWHIATRMTPLSGRLDRWDGQRKSIMKKNAEYLISGV